MTQLKPATLKVITRIFDSLDYAALGSIYCDEGGDAFWQERRGPCKELGIKLAAVLRDRLRPGGRSLYVGARVAELPPLVMAPAELPRTDVAYNLLTDEAEVLNRATPTPPL